MTNIASVTQQEEWRPVGGYENEYVVSNFGRVKSLVRIKEITIGRRNKTLLTMKRKYGGVLLSPIKIHRGYTSVVLSKNDNKKRFFVHVLVAKAFLKKPEEKNAHEVNHKDFITNNNRIENLEWVTRKQNVEHARLGGRLIGLRKATGEGHPSHKLTNKDVYNMIFLRKSGFTTSEIMKKYPVTRSSINKVLRGLTWKSITKGLI